MRNHRLRDADGTEYDPETWQRVGEAPGPYDGHKWSDSEIMEMQAAGALPTTTINGGPVRCSPLASKALKPIMEEEKKDA